MDIALRYVHQDENDWSVTRAIAKILHAGESDEERKINFRVQLDPNVAGGVGHNGQGRLTVPSVAIGNKFLSDVRAEPIKFSGKKVHFRKLGQSPRPYIVETLAKTPFINPDVEEKHLKTLWALEEKLRIDTLQFGVFFRPSYPGGRAFSVEWEKAYVDSGQAWLHFEYDHKLIRIRVECASLSASLFFSELCRLGMNCETV